jgi:hypothetical protein
MHEQGITRMLEFAILFLQAKATSEAEFSAAEKQIKFASNLMQFLVSLQIPESGMSLSLSLSLSLCVY